MKTANDRIRVFTKSYMTNDILCLVEFYQVVVGVNAINLYLLLKSEFVNLRQSDELNTTYLMESLSCNIDELNKSIDRLCAVKLLQIYVKNDLYIIELISPLSVLEFINDSLLNSLFQKNLSESVYQKKCQKFLKADLDLSSYQNISKSSNEVFGINKQVSTTLKNIHAYNEILLLKDEYNYVFTDNDLDAAIYLLTINQVERLVAIRLVNDSMTNNSFNIEKFKSLLKALRGKRYVSDRVVKVSNKAEFLEVLNEDSVIFLRLLSGGTVLTTSEKALVYRLRNQFLLNDGVINVILRYVYDVFNRQINENYVEKLARTMQRNKINNVEDATTFVKSIRKVKADDANMPEWMKPKDVVEASEDEQEELKRLVEEMAQL